MDKYYFKLTLKGGSEDDFNKKCMSVYFDAPVKGFVSFHVGETKASTILAVYSADAILRVTNERF